MCNSFLDFWNGERVDAIGSNRGKLDTYFYIKTHFGKEKYLEINNFKIRQSICKIRVSAHSLNIETDRYKNIIRPERKCTNCSKGDIEDEKHFIVDCPLYENIRVKCFDKVIDLCPNFRYMDTSSKFVWLFTNEHEQVLKKLGSFIEECFLLRGHN
jgi:hypothetical protein